MVLRVLKGPGLAFLALLAFFWLATAVNTAFGFLENGRTGAWHALVRHSSSFSVDENGNLVIRSHSPAFSYGVLAMLTAIFVFICKRTLQAMLSALKRGFQTRFNDPS